MNKISRIATMGLLLGIAACSRTDDKAASLDPSAGTPSDTLPVEPTAQAPEALVKLKAMAQRAGEEIEAARWPVAEALADTLRQSYEGIKEHLAQADSALDRQVAEELDDLDAAIRDQTSDAASRTAQALREAADKIERTY